MRYLILLFIMVSFTKCELFSGKKEKKVSSDTTNRVTAIDSIKTEIPVSKAPTQKDKIVPDKPTTINAEILKSFTQTNAFYYVTQGGASYRADILKYFTPGDPNPVVRFRHINASTGASHTEDFIDYVSDARKTYRGWIRYDYTNQKLVFVHAMRDDDDFQQSYQSSQMNIKDFSNCNWTVQFEDCNLQQFRDQSSIIKTKQKLLGCNTTPNASAVTIGNGGQTGGSGINPRYTVNRTDPNSWVVSFQTYARILFHPSTSYFPAAIMDFIPGTGSQLRIDKGQWVQVMIYYNNNAVWSLATDMDHR